MIDESVDAIWNIAEADADAMSECLQVGNRYLELGPGEVWWNGISSRSDHCLLEIDIRARDQLAKLVNSWKEQRKSKSGMYV